MGICIRKSPKKRLGRCATRRSAGAGEGLEAAAERAGATLAEEEATMATATTATEAAATREGDTSTTGREEEALPTRTAVAEAAALAGEVDTGAAATWEN